MIEDQNKDIEIERLKTTCYSLNNKVALVDDLQRELDILRQRLADSEKIRAMQKEEIMQYEVQQQEYERTKKDWEAARQEFERTRQEYERARQEYERKRQENEAARQQLQKTNLALAEENERLQKTLDETLRDK